MRIDIHVQGVATALLLLGLAGPALAQVETTFDADLGGWTVNGDNVYLWNGVDGNPDGCLEVQDAASGPWSVAIAPAAYLGDWSSFTPADSLTYDAIHLPAAGQNGNPPDLFRIEGPGGVATFDPGSSPADVWNHFAAPIDSTAWNVTSGTWAGLLANVTDLRVAAEMISGDETVRLDNIRLTGTPGSPFRLCEVQRFEVGTLGWAGDNASLVHETTGGDLGRFLRVQETGAGARLLAPPWYAGDWGPLDGSGAITFSFAVLTATVQAGRDVRVTLTGPGGSAYASEPSESFLPLDRFWHILSWPIDASAWTVTAGTWAGLLADVREMAIAADVSAGNDRFGVDNLARGGPACDPEPPLPLVFHDAGHSVCGAWRFRDASALATNPAGGELYALVNASVGSGGGVYPVTGPDAGVRLHSYSLPIGLVFTADGDGFVSENNSGVLSRFVGADSSMTWANTFHAGDDDPAGMIVAPPGFEGPNVTAGDLLVADHGNGGADEIWAVSPDSANGERMLVADPGNVDWYDLATDGSTVWACDAVDDDLLWTIHPDGSTSTLALSRNVTNRNAFAYDAGQGLLYAMQTTNPVGLYTIDPTNGDVALIAEGFGAVGAGNLEVDAATRTLWVSDERESRIWRICLPPAGTVATPEPAIAAAGLSLLLAPHPVVGGTRIALDLPRAADVRLDVVDAAGRRVRRLDAGIRPAGRTTVEWDARDAGGRQVAAGVYFIRLEAAGAVCTRKAVVVR